MQQRARVDEAAVDQGAGDAQAQVFKVQCPQGAVEEGRGNGLQMLGLSIDRTAAEASAHLARKGYMARTIGIKLRYADFRGATRDQTIAQATQDAAMLRRVAGQCLKRVPLQQRLRLLGVRVASLVPVAEAALHPAAAHSPGPAQGETLGLF